jgi:tight adherence protein C
MGDMDASTLMFFIFWGLFFLAAAILLTVRGLLGRRRRKAEEATHEDFIAQQRADRAAAIAAAAPDLVKAPEAETVNSEDDAAKQVSAAEEASEPVPAEPAVAPETQAIEQETPEPVAVGPKSYKSSSQYGDRYSNWAPPEQPIWKPPTQSQVNEVSWTTQELFRVNDSDFEEPDNIPVVTPDQIPSVSGSDYVFGSATPAMAAMIPLTDQVRVEKELKEAGYYQPHAKQNFIAIRFALMFVTMVGLGGLLLVVPPVAEIPVAIAALAIPGLLWAIPRVAVQNRAADRKSQLERGMPDMLDMLNMCVSQGLTIPSSLKRIASDLKPVYPALAAELTLVVRQAEIGNMRIALDNFAERVSVPEVDSFVSLMTQSERMGTSVSDALTEYANTMRESLRQRTDEKANKASFKLMFPTVLFMMPAVFMFLMGPAILELQDFFDQGGVENLGEGIGTLEDVQNLQRQ